MVETFRAVKRMAMRQYEILVYHESVGNVQNV